MPLKLNEDSSEVRICAMGRSVGQPKKRTKHRGYGSRKCTGSMSETSERIGLGRYTSGEVDTVLRGKMKGHQLLWFGHVMKQNEEDLVRAILGSKFKGWWVRDLLELTSEELVRMIMTLCEVSMRPLLRIEGLDLATGWIMDRVIYCYLCDDRPWM